MCQRLYFVWTINTKDYNRNQTTCILYNNQYDIVVTESFLIIYDAYCDMESSHCYEIVKIFSSLQWIIEMYCLV